MKCIVKAELIKFNKRHILLFLVAFNCISVLYALGIYFNWGWVTLEGKYDLLMYVGAMWQLLFLIGIPMIVFMYIGASIIGSERNQGQLILEVTRVANKGRLIIAKFLSILMLVFSYFISNIIISSLCYVFIVSKTEYASDKMIIWNVEIKGLVISGIAVVLYLIMSAFIAMFISTKSSAIFSTVVGLTIYAVLTVASRVEGLGNWIPGYLALNSSAAEINRLTIGYQTCLGIIIILVMLWASIRQFNKTDL